MKTHKPLSTISFNTPAFLKLKLDELYKSRIIDFYTFVKHVGEDDEAGKKDHCHVYMEPAKPIHSEDLRDVFAEPDIAHPDRPPLNCLPWRPSKYGDWQLYALHDRMYLMSKGMERRYAYNIEQSVTSDPMELHRLFYLIDRTKLTPWAAIADAQQSGISWTDYACSGRVPIPQIKNYREAWSVSASRDVSESPYMIAFDPSKKWRRCTLPNGNNVLISPSGEAISIEDFQFNDKHEWRRVYLSSTCSVVITPENEVYSVPERLRSFDVDKL